MISFLQYLLKYNELEERYNSMLKGFVANSICKFLFSIDRNGNQIYQNNAQFLKQELRSKEFFIYNVFSTNRLELEAVNFVADTFFRKYLTLFNDAMDDPEYYYFMEVYRYFDDFEVKLDRYNRGMEFWKYPSLIVRL